MTQPSWNPNLHPRYPAGHIVGGVNVGGKFMPKSSQGSALWAQQVSAALAKAGGGSTPGTPAPTPTPKPARNLATRLIGPAPPWQQSIQAGVSYSDWGVQQLKTGQARSVRQWYVHDTQGNKHGPFGTQSAADNYYAKLTGRVTAPAVKAPTVIPAGVNTYTTRVPKTAASGVTRNVAQHWFDYQGQSYGPFPSVVARDKQIAITTRPPHQVAKGTDLIGQAPRMHPNRLAKKVAGQRDPQATRSGYMAASTIGSGAWRSPNAADADLRTLADLQGFSGKPEVVTKSEITKLDQAGTHYILYRGVKSTGAAAWRYKNTASVAKTAAQIQDELRDGDAYYGVGVYGNGYYFGTDRSTAVSYSDRTSGSVVRVALPKNAKIAQYGSLQVEASRLIGHTAASAESKALYADVGRYAAARGYDAIRVPTGYVILNRSILKIQDQ